MQAYIESKFQDDTVFQSIERDYLSLADHECKENNKLLKAIVEENLIPLMKRDRLFSIIFVKIGYGGSYYKGTKYGRPNEFDLDLRFDLEHYNIDLAIDSNHDKYGYIRIKINSRSRDFNCLRYKEELEKITGFNDYLDQKKFRSWLEGVLSSAFDTLLGGPSGYIKHNGSRYRMSLRKSGPAFTIAVTSPNGDDVFDIDLVAVIEFSCDDTDSGFKKNIDNVKSFGAVPKPLNERAFNENLYWRLSFFKKEKAILSGEVKPVIKLMKKFRDTWDMKSIASYFIETIFFHELESHKKNLNQFVRKSKTSLFMHGMKKLRDALEIGKLPYFWDERLNLFQNISGVELQNHARRLSLIIHDIEENIGRNELILRQYICGTGM